MYTYMHPYIVTYMHNKYIQCIHAYREIALYVHEENDEKKDEEEETEAEDGRHHDSDHNLQRTHGQVLWEFYVIANLS